MHVTCVVGKWKSLWKEINGNKIPFLPLFDTNTFIPSKFIYIQIILFFYLAIVISFSPLSGFERITFNFLSLKLFLGLNAWPPTFYCSNYFEFERMTSNFLSLKLFSGLNAWPPTFLSLKLFELFDPLFYSLFSKKPTWYILKPNYSQPKACHRRGQKIQSHPTKLKEKK